jgi:hypothetical protein
MLAGILPGSYALSLVLTAIAAIPRNGVRISLCVPFAIAAMHVGYGWGFGYGMWARLFRTRAWDAHGRMAAISR